MKSNIGWGDSEVRNVSTGGMLIQMIPPPPIGSYVEICRGDFRIVGRVRWQSVDRFGLQALEPVDIEHLHNPVRKTKRTGQDRRKVVRPGREVLVAPRDFSWQTQLARTCGQRLEFLAVILFGAVLAVMLADSIGMAFAAPLDAISTALSGR